ncbi:MAG: phosphodiester glycosidase family protein [Chthoniobacterales bacterium]|nr:phosphodiester glycosidase family protein [Chthoniobacterales bacterium]
MRKLSAVLLAIVASASITQADWQIVSAKSEPSSVAEIEHRHLTMQNEANGESATLHLAIFDPGKATLRIIDQPAEPRVDLAQVMQKEKCLAAVNGGYFDPKYEPVGLLVSEGRVIAPSRKARLLSGILSVANGKVRLQRVAEFSRKSRTTEAVQAGPLLIDHTRAVTGLDDSRSARRTFVAVGAPNQVALGFCSQVSLAQLAAILASAYGAGDLKIQRALNLDGGSSSAFWFRGDGEPFSISEQKTVRDFVAIVAK